MIKKTGVAVAVVGSAAMRKNEEKKKNEKKKNEEKKKKEKKKQVDWPLRKQQVGSNG